MEGKAARGAQLSLSTCSHKASPRGHVPSCSPCCCRRPQGHSLPRPSSSPRSPAPPVLGDGEEGARRACKQSRLHGRACDRALCHRSSLCVFLPRCYRTPPFLTRLIKPPLRTSLVGTGADFCQANICLPAACLFGSKITASRKIEVQNLQLLVKIKPRAAGAAQWRSGPGRPGLSPAKFTAPAPEEPRASSTCPARRSPARLQLGTKDTEERGERLPGKEAGTKLSRPTGPGGSPVPIVWPLLCSRAAQIPNCANNGDSGSRMERALLGEAPRSPAPAVPKGPPRCPHERPTALSAPALPQVQGRAAGFGHRHTEGSLQGTGARRQVHAASRGHLSALFWDKQLLAFSGCTLKRKA